MIKLFKKKYKRSEWFEGLLFAEEATSKGVFYIIPNHRRDFISGVNDYLGYVEKYLK